MRKIFLLFLIFFLGFILRFWQLGVNPPSLDWDEASLGYNAYSLFTTGKDEYGNPWPLSIRSFNDYKPPLYTYLTILPVAMTGLNEFSTRFISALFGSLSVVIGYFLIKELLPTKTSFFYLLSSILFAVSPWHIQFSRVAFEANMALFFFLLGIWLFLKSISQVKFFIFSFCSFAVSAYAYHSPRLVIPVLLGGLVFIYRQEIRKQFSWFLFGLILFIMLMLPLIVQMRLEVTARFGSVTVLNPDQRLESSIKLIDYDLAKGDFWGKLIHNRRIVYLREILAGYLDHFNFDFLFLTGDSPGRHHAVGMGMLYLWDLPFILFGIFLLMNKRNQKINTLFWWFLVAPIASSLTTGTPHAVRSILYLPTYQIITAVGITGFIDRLKKLKKNGKIILFFTFTLFILSFFYYLHMYWLHTPMEYSQWWQYGYKQAVEEVRKLAENYQKIIVSYRYDQPYIFFLFYDKIDPSWYQGNWGGGEIKRAERSFGKYEFRNIDWERDSKLSNTMLVGTPEEIPENTDGLVREINFLDGSVAFRIVTK